MALLPMICLVLVFSSCKLRLEILAYVKWRMNHFSLTQSALFVWRSNFFQDSPPAEVSNGHRLPGSLRLLHPWRHLREPGFQHIRGELGWLSYNILPGWVAIISPITVPNVGLCSLLAALLKSVNFSSHNMNSAFTNDWFSMDSCLEKNWDWTR